MHWMDKNILAMESEVAYHTSRGEQIDWQTNTSPNCQPPRVKKTKDEVASGRTNEHATHAQTQASSDMAQATHMKVQILQDIIIQQTLWNRHRCQGGSYGTRVLHLKTR